MRSVVDYGIETADYPKPFLQVIGGSIEFHKCEGFFQHRKLLICDALDRPSHALRVEKAFHVEYVIYIARREAADKGSAIWYEPHKANPLQIADDFAKRGAAHIIFFAEFLLHDLLAIGKNSGENIHGNGLKYLLPGAFGILIFVAYKIQIQHDASPSIKLYTILTFCKRDVKKGRKMIKEENISKILDALEKEYPDAECGLNHENIYQLLVAVALSAQTTDKSVNQVTPALFERYPEAKSLAEASLEEVEEYIKRIGMYRTKAKNIIAMAKKLCEDFGGEVPDDYDSLVSLPGVGRKTANVVLSVGFGHQRIAVDTHVFRVANRIGLVHAKDVLGTELALMERIPKERWTKTHHSLIFHGRACCEARKPKCDSCPINIYCEYVCGEDK